MKKIFILALLIFFFTTKDSYAADVEFSCDENSCSPSSASSFLPNTAWYPDKNVAKTITIENSTSDTRTVTAHAVNISTTNQLDTVINLLIRNSTNNQTIWNNRLSDLYTMPEISFLSIPSNTTLEYELAFKMDQHAGNEFQNSSTTFDLVIQLSDIESGGNTSTHTPTPSNTPTVTPSSDTNNPSQNNNQSNSSSGGTNSSNTDGSQTLTQSILIGVATVANALGLSTINPNVSDVLGATESAEAITPSTATENQTRSVSQCSENWYWTLIVGVQLLAVSIISRRFKGKKLVLLTVGTAIISGITIFLLVCTKLYALVALIPILIIFVKQVIEKH